MTIQEAINSGKRFRRECMREEISFIVNTQGEIIAQRKISGEWATTKDTLWKNDILATDWIIVNEGRVITASDIYAAYERGLKNNNLSGNIAYRIVKELGLE